MNTLEIFWAQAPDTETDYTDPLVSIADSLRAIASRHEHIDPEVPAPVADTGQVADLEQALEDLEARYVAVDAQLAVKQALLDDVLAICKPSVGKLAIKIREALAEPGAETDEEPDEQADGEQGPPANDAPVEEWREYARAVGYASEDVDTANRSMLRTLLGIEQPDAAQ